MSCAFVVLASAGRAAFAEVKPANIFGENMVLQRESPIPVWGIASAGETVEVSFNGRSRSAVADKGGRWRVELSPEKAGGPYRLSVKGEKNAVEYGGVLVGDVWLCGGQSNMEWPVRQALNGGQEAISADFPRIRHIRVPKETESMPDGDMHPAEWQAAAGGKAGDFSAVGYYFAKKMYKELGVPVGLINNSWGGTHIETWTSRAAFEKSDEFRGMIAGLPEYGPVRLFKDYIAALKTKIAARQGLPLDPAEPMKYKDAATDDSGWPKMALPNAWETQGLDTLDGKVWFRRTVELSEDPAGQPAVLWLSKIDDIDETFVNGIKAGGTADWSAVRKYDLPAGALKKGANLIAVRVTDTGGPGGLYGDAVEMKLTIGGKTIPLSGQWSYIVESVPSALPPNLYPTVLNDAMFRPLVPYAVKGILWYQGEDNCARAWQYRKAFPLMINDWRAQLGQDDLPFYFVQLASFHNDPGDSNTGSCWAELREAQAMALSVPNTGMCVTTDIGDPGDIHPKNKDEVGRRLAAMALRDLYGGKRVSTGPAYKSIKVSGDKAVISFSGVGGGLVARGTGGTLNGFELAGADKVFYPAEAYISGGTVVLRSPKVPYPAAARYGWRGDAGADNLYNKESFPAAPFRTDDWKGVTEGAVYEIRKII
jgi:sialate O-acetylesterase